MKLGFALPVSGSWATPDRLRHLAWRAEDSGFDSVWTFQRLLAPEGLAEPYRSVLDPTVSLAFAAAATSRIRLGLGVVNLPFIAPVVLAKQLATLDVLSGGRVDAGLGVGWSAEEFAATGASLAERGARAEEYLTVLTKLFTDDPVEHTGRFYRVPRAAFAPKPIQRPFPLLMGGSVPAALRRIGRIADGWISSSTADLSSIGTAIGVVRGAATAAGRDPAALRFVCRGAVRVRPGGTPDRRPLTGSIAEIHDDVHELARMGLTEFFFDLNFDPRIGSPDVDPDAAMEVAEEVLSAFARS